MNTARSNIPAELNNLTSRIIGCAMEVHTTLGPGLLESVYERALLHELGLAGLRAEQQVELIVPYKNIEIRGQRADLVVESTVIVELKVVETIAAIHKAQLLSYLRSSGLPLGLLINYNAEHLRHGIKRMINERSPVITPQSPPRPLR